MYKVFGNSNTGDVITTNDSRSIRLCTLDEDYKDITPLIAYPKYATSENTKYIEGEWLPLDTPKVLELVKSEYNTELLLAVDAYMENLKLGNYPNFERQTFERQKQEAKTWEIDNLAPTPYIDILANNRQIDRTELIGRILSKAEQFEVLAFAIVGQRQRYEDLIEAAITVDELNAIEFSFAI